MRKGFTLVEMLAVTAILAVIALIAAGRLQRTVRAAKVAAAQADLAAIRDAFCSERGYLADLGPVPGFSPACVRTASLLVATNAFGVKAVSANAHGTHVRTIRLDAGGETPESCAAERRAMPAAFTGWDPERGRGWRGPYLRTFRAGSFPARGDRRFAGDATFEERNFFPPADNLRLPEEFKDRDRASVYGFTGEPAAIDPWGNPYVVQVPPPQAFSGVTNVAEEARFEYARVVSAGPDGVLSTPCHAGNATNWYATSWTERGRRLSRQAGRIDDGDLTARGDDLVLFLRRNDVDEGEEVDP